MYGTKKMKNTFCRGLHMTYKNGIADERRGEDDQLMHTIRRFLHSAIQETEACFANANRRSGRKKPPLVPFGGH